MSLHYYSSSFNGVKDIALKLLAALKAKKNTHKTAELLTSLMVPLAKKITSG